MKKILIIVAAVAMSFAPAFAEPSDTEQAPDAGKAPVLTTKLSGFVMGEYNYTSQKNVSPTNTFSLRMARMQVAGKILGDFDYRLQVQVSGTTTGISGPHIVDAYVEWVKYKEFCVKVGEFKRAFTFENPMHPIDQGFYGYSTAISKLAGMNDRVGEHASNGRDIGLQLQGDFLKIDGRNWLHYQVGVFNGEGINTKDRDNRKDIIGGIWVMPLDGLRIGGFGWTGSRADIGGKNRYALSVEYAKHDWTLRSEYIHSQGLGADAAAGDKADGIYALCIAPVIEKKLHVKARYDLYRNQKAWASSKTFYEVGADYLFNKNLQLNVEYARVNERAGHKNYNLVDVELDVRF